MLPISHFVLKVHSRCDLACDHCYVYEHSDQSWRTRPLGISPSVTRQAAARIAEHAAAHRLPSVHVILHGGEPLLIRSARAGEAAVLNVFENSADDAAAHPAVAARQHGAEDLADTCRKCPLLERCGGGHYPHRYRTGSGFRNPSVYCEDLKALIMHIGEPKHAGPGETHATGPSPIAKHFGLAQVAAIADGPVDRELAQRLALTQLKYTQALFYDVGELVSDRTTPAKQVAADGWELLRAVGAQAPWAVRTVLALPFAREWARHCEERLLRQGQLSPAEGCHMAGFALAAALRAGMDATLTLPRGERSVHLPTLGTVICGGSPDKQAMIGVRAGWFDESTTAIEAWHSSARGVHPGDGFLVEDLDPYRNSYGLPIAGRLSEPAAARWREMAEASLKALSEWAPRYAEQVSSCVRVLVPLAPDPSGRERSSTSELAFGAIAAALPSDPDALAMLLAHESQHLVLDRVFDAFDPCDPDDERTFPVRWRDDLRPIRGVLQGTFAHLAMAEVLLARRNVAPGDTQQAHALAIEYGTWSQDALDRLAAADALLPLGASFVQRLNTRIRHVLEA